MEKITQLIKDATHARALFLGCIEGLSSTQGHFKTSAEAWSIAEIVEHLVLAERGSLNRVWSAADGLRQDQPVWVGEAVHRGKSIEEVVAETWVPHQPAPEVARPRRFGPLGFWVVAMQCNQPLLEATHAALTDLDPAAVITPHPISGPWDALQWLSFIRFHLDHHRQQIERVKQSTAFPV